VDVVEDGRGGVLVEPGDVAGLREALTHWLDPARADERDAMGRAARALVCERLSLASVASRLSALYGELVQPVGRRVAVGATVAGRPSGKELPR
jgi:glycosyltransferase involved in cell wall biosynthesis